MGERTTEPFVAVDIGNTRIKLGFFSDSASDSLPVPSHSTTLGADWTAEELKDWLAVCGPVRQWCIASVNRTGTRQLLDRLAACADAVTRVLSYGDLPIVIDVDQPETVGLDRLANAVAANYLRQPGRATIVIDVGSAITVDLVTKRGSFAGGAILPGIAMSARALHEFTDLLPLVPMRELEAPPAAIGRTTAGAMRAGVYWAALGAMNALIERFSQEHENPEVFLTGGAAPSVAALIRNSALEPVRYVPHLTLSGIAVAHSA